MFPDERFDEIGNLFDAIKEKNVGRDQWKINGLAVLLTCLEEECEEFDGTDLGIPLLCKTRALEAAYHLGKGDSR